MQTKTWIIPLGDGFDILCRKETILGRWVGFAVVLLKDGTGITRYDSAHGFAHRDVLGQRSGLLYKESYTSLSYRQALRYGVEDFKARHRAYHVFYLAH